MVAYIYERSPTSAALVDRLVQSDPAETFLLAGGTDLLTQIRSRLVRPRLVLDIKGVPEFKCLEATGDHLSVGAAVTFNQLLEASADLAPWAGLLEAAAQVASYPIRNRATVAGNVANASPCADSVPPLCVQAAEAVLLGPDGERRLPVHELIVGNRETRCEPGEVLCRLEVPRPGDGAWSGFAKRKRVRGHDLALASAALMWDPDQQRLRLSVGSCTPVPTLIDLDGMCGGEPDVEQAISLAMDEINPIDDVRASVEYRRDMVAVMVRRLFQRLSHERGGRC